MRYQHKHVTTEVWNSVDGTFVGKGKQMFWSNHSDQDRDAPIRLEIGNYLLS